MIISGKCIEEGVPEPTRRFVCGHNPFPEMRHSQEGSGHSGLESEVKSDKAKRRSIK